MSRTHNDVPYWVEALRKGKYNGKHPSEVNGFYNHNCKKIVSIVETWCVHTLKVKGPKNKITELRLDRTETRNRPFLFSTMVKNFLIDEKVVPECRIVNGTSDYNKVQEDLARPHIVSRKVERDDSIVCVCDEEPKDYPEYDYAAHSHYKNSPYERSIVDAKRSNERSHVKSSLKKIASEWSNGEDDLSWDDDPELDMSTARTDI